MSLFERNPMNKKSALVVDDSRLARFVLKEMLVEQGLSVSTSESAEDALIRLCDHHPDIIFMDHTMPGMDGLTAVQAIKKNPETTTIPIMMYTSKEGEVYADQARSLGAIGVLPKQLQADQLINVLKELQLLPGTEKETTPIIELPASHSFENNNHDTDIEKRLGNLEEFAHSAMESVESKSFLSMLNALLEEQRQKIQIDLKENSDQIALLVSENQRNNENNALLAHHNILPIQSKHFFLKAASITLVALLPALWFASQYQETIQQLETVMLENKQLQHMQAVTSSHNTLVQIDDASQAEIDKRLDSLYQTLEWAINTKHHFTYNDMAFGNDALETLSTLIDHLEAVDFTGEIKLISHVGNFCLTENDSNEWVMPNQDLPINECQIKTLAPIDALTQGEQQSTTFANYLSDFNNNDQQNIRISIESLGNQQPAMSYPSPNALELAGEWNQIAINNQRIEVFIQPDDTNEQWIGEVH